MYNVFNILNSFKKYESYGDIKEGKQSFDLSSTEQEIYESLQKADKNRLMRFNS